jgi:hypothetical protein
LPQGNAISYGNKTIPKEQLFIFFFFFGWKSSWITHLPLGKGHYERQHDQFFRNGCSFSFSSNESHCIWRW